jgi:phosphatidylglycerophosphatase A
MKAIAYIIASGFGAGYSPVAPGTAGALFFIIAAGWWFPLAPVSIQIGLCVGLFFLSVVSSSIVEKDLIARFGQESGHDAGMIVIDEVIGQAIAMIAIPISLYAIIAAFVLFRVFDITKPFPANRIQTLPGGWGITMDDVIAGIYANLVIQLARIFF